MFGRRDPATRQREHGRLVWQRFVRRVAVTAAVVLLLLFAFTSLVSDDVPPPSSSSAMNNVSKVVQTQRLQSGNNGGANARNAAAGSSSERKASHIRYKSQADMDALAASGDDAAEKNSGGATKTPPPPKGATHAAVPLAPPLATAPLPNSVINTQNGNGVAVASSHLDTDVMKARHNDGPAPVRRPTAAETAKRFAVHETRKPEAATQQAQTPQTTRQIVANGNENNGMQRVSTDARLPASKRLRILVAHEFMDRVGWSCDGRLLFVLKGMASMHCRSVSILLAYNTRHTSHDRLLFFPCSLPFYRRVSAMRLCYTHAAGAPCKSTLTSS
jgi:hypothetical protein